MEIDEDRLYNDNLVRNPGRFSRVKDDNLCASQRHDCLSVRVHHIIYPLASPFNRLVMVSDVDLSETKKADNDSISSTLKTGRSLVLLQLLTRVLTFVLNQSLVRLASPEVFGTAAIQFDLIYSTVLFLSREGIRNALLDRKSVV